MDNMAALPSRASNILARMQLALAAALCVGFFLPMGVDPDFLGHGPYRWYLYGVGPIAETCFFAPLLLAGLMVRTKSPGVRVLLSVTTVPPLAGVWFLANLAGGNGFAGDRTVPMIGRWISEYTSYGLTGMSLAQIAAVVASRFGAHALPGTSLSD